MRRNVRDLIAILLIAIVLILFRTHARADEVDKFMATVGAQCAGAKTWCPVFAPVALPGGMGFRVVDWTGGDGGPKPPVGAYADGDGGLTQDQGAATTVNRQKLKTTILEILEILRDNL